MEFQRPQRKMKKLEERYNQLEASHLTSEVHQEMQHIQAQLTEHEMQEILRWQQRSKEHWLANGDGNTQYFQSRASACKRYNTIFRIKDGEGCWKNIENEIQDILLQHFWSVFASNRPSDTSIDEVLAAVPSPCNHRDERLATPTIHSSKRKRSFFRYVPFQIP
ncbi:UNVERIFIED_CONTAM: hypothetical protein Sradi_0749400 [Sesamum radiatum]|uniref:Uncharacterized protein n=1 Tax=Sesamum radiatum TaxID=300843 RepID=A0AAW2VQF8_SESRA